MSAEEAVAGVLRTVAEKYGLKYSIAEDGWHVLEGHSGLRIVYREDVGVRVVVPDVLVKIGGGEFSTDEVMVYGQNVLREVVGIVNALSEVFEAGKIGKEIEDRLRET